jgi:hypothetical protein
MAQEPAPYVPADSKVAELTPRAVLIGAAFGVLFGAVTVYLALKVGLTVSASIPIAVLSIMVFRKLGRTVDIVQIGDIEIGIKAARMAFPKCYFDDVRTKRLVDCLKRYRRSIPTTTGEPSTPLHDEYSHGADAFRYLAKCADRLKNDDVNYRGKIEYERRAVI